MAPAVAIVPFKSPKIGRPGDHPWRRSRNVPWQPQQRAKRSGEPIPGPWGGRGLPASGGGWAQEAVEISSTRAFRPVTRRIPARLFIGDKVPLSPPQRADMTPLTPDALCSSTELFTGPSDHEWRPSPGEGMRTAASSTLSGPVPSRAALAAGLRRGPTAF